VKGKRCCFYCSTFGSTASNPLKYLSDILKRVVASCVCEATTPSPKVGLLLSSIEANTEGCFATEGRAIEAAPKVGLLLASIEDRSKKQPEGRVAPHRREATPQIKFEVFYFKF
jgi:hypothetical protein